MKSHKVVLTLTLAVICILPLAGITGCTGPPRGYGNNTNSTQFGEYEIDATDVFYDTTNTTE